MCTTCETELERVRAENAQLRQELQDRKLIERAKGVIMKRRGLDEDAAYRMLQKLSTQRNTKLATLAQQVIDADALVAGKP